MRWPKYWSFSFSIISSKEIPGLISFGMDRLALLTVQGVTKSQTWLKQLSTHGPHFPGSYAILFFTASDFTFTTSHIHNWVLFMLWLYLFLLSGVISPLFSSSILGIYPVGSSSFSVTSFLPFHTVHGVLKVRILKWIAISFSRGSAQPRDQTRVSRTAGSRFTGWATREAPMHKLDNLMRTYRLAQGTLLSALWWSK